jgi:ParB family transcriptional regulator, chromosome partitioning protein
LPATAIWLAIFLCRGLCRRGELSLDAAKAFCLVEDHARQEAVCKALGKPVTQAASVRLHLMKGAMRATDRLVQFVGLDAYLAANGRVTRDLFDDDATYIDDPALAAELAEAKLQDVRDTPLSLGWGWASIHIASTRPLASGQRLSAEVRPFNTDEQERLAFLSLQRDVFDNALAEAEDDDPRWEARDHLVEQIRALQESRRTWPSDLMAHAGVILSVDQKGRMESVFGGIANSGQAKIKAIQRKPEKACAKIAARSVALRQELTRRPEEALRVATFALIQCLRTGHGVPGVTLMGRGQWLAEHDGLGEMRDALLTGVPTDADDSLRWCFSADMPNIAAIFVVLVASNLYLAHEGWRGNLRSRAAESGGRHGRCAWDRHAPSLAGR